jgi:hypothetical protein
VFQSDSHGIQFDFGATTLTITTPNGITNWGDLGPFTFSGFDAILTKVSLASIQGFGLDFISDVKFNEHSITFDLDGGLSAGAGAKLVYNMRSRSRQLSPCWALACWALPPRAASQPRARIA